MLFGRIMVSSLARRRRCAPAVMRSNNFQLTPILAYCARGVVKINGFGHLSVVHSTNRALAEEVANHRQVHQH